MKGKTKKPSQDNEQLLRSIFEQVTDGIFVTDPNGRYTMVNRRLCEMLGYSRDELLTKHIGSLTAAKDHPLLDDIRIRLAQDPLRVYQLEWELLHKNGGIVPVELGVRITEDGRWLVVARDIAQRRQVEQALKQSAEEIGDLYDDAPCGYHTIDRNGVYLRVNRTEQNWLGYTQGELVRHKRFVDLLAPASVDAYEKYAAQLLKRGDRRNLELELELSRRDGSVLPALLRATAVSDDNGDVAEIRAVLLDMSDMAEARAYRRLAATVFEHTNDAIIVTDAERNIIAVNPAFSRITGYGPEEAVGRTPSLIKSGRHQQEFYAQLWDALATRGTWQGEIWDCRKSGELFPAWESITAIKDCDGSVSNYISIFSDITVIKEAEQKLTQLAYQDTLTGLANRLLFNDRLGHVLAHARRHKKRVALLLLDLDRFKLINDSLGHAAGDQLLQIVATRLKKSVREEDTVARMGGDEFAIIFTALEAAEDVAVVAQKITAAITQPVRVGKHDFRISISIGISVFPDDAVGNDELYKTADLALYGAKARGRNTYAFYTPEMTRVADETLLIGRNLRQALELNQLELAYQPQVNLFNGKVVAMEALLRWNSPEHGLQLPASFVHVAEETDLIDTLGDWVIEKALGNLERWRRAGAAPVKVAVNISERQLRKLGFLDDLRRKLTAYHLYDGFGLEIEINERVLQIEPDAVEALRTLKPLGVSVSIDDFGTGYSCLNSLKHLPVDSLKIDRSFVGGIPGDDDDKAITASIIAMAHQMGIRVVAEGVESQEQLAFVLEHRCDRAQGFLFSAPVAEAQSDALLSTRFTRALSALRVPMSAGR